MKPPFRAWERKPFDADRCTRCGLCLSRCPVMELPLERARTEIASLIGAQGNPEALPDSTRKVLTDCTACFACNLVCPEQCQPANLFMDLWHEHYEWEGLPERARFFLPYSRPNYRTCVQERFSRTEKDALERWASLEPAEVLFYPGCNLLMTPGMMLSRLFDDLPIRGSLDYCCGEAYFRMGLYGHVEQAAQRCTRYFKTLGARKVYLACAGDLNMFTHVLPQFGADFSGIRFIPFLAHLYEKLTAGAWPLVKRFEGRTITVQDSCHTKMYEEDYYLWPRKILSFLGFELREAPRHGDTALCCGIGGGISHASAYSKKDLVAGQRACLKNLRSAKADSVAVYCSGCLEMLALSREGGDMRHVIELVQEAIGEKVRTRHRVTAFHLALGIVLNQARGSGRFKPPPIE